MADEMSREQFIEKMEWEGSILGVLEWGGSGCFPAAIQGDALIIEEKLAEIEAWLYPNGDGGEPDVAE